MERMERGYSELVQAMIQKTRTSPPAVVCKLSTFAELVDALQQLDQSRLFIVSVEPQLAIRLSPANGRLHQSDQDSLQLDEVHMSRLVSNMEDYFSWFGDVNVVYILGSSVAVVYMNSSFSVSHVLRSNMHDISVNHDAIIQAPDSVRPAAGRYRVVFTVNAYMSECLSLNVILSILKHADPASVVMVRRVNRLGYDGSLSMTRYFSKFGRVIRIFMLPLRSRKKNLSLPSKTGFLVMDSPTACEAIIAQKDHPIIPGVAVSVGKFTHRALLMHDYTL
jgi:hypothetical protein